jgi:hypothetical protein
MAGPNIRIFPDKKTPLAVSNSDIQKAGGAELANDFHERFDVVPGR